MNRGRWLVSALLLLGLVAGTSCDRAPTVEIPSPDTSEAEPQVRSKIADARAAVERDRGSARAWGRYGMILAAHGQVEAAETAYGEARRLDARDFRWSYYPGVMLALVRPERAATHLAQAVELDGTYVPLRVRYGRLLFKLDRAVEAEIQFRAALREDGACSPARQGLGEIALQRGDLPTAISELQAAVRLQPGNGPAASALSQAFLRSGQREFAEKAAEAAREAGPTPPPLTDPLYYEVEREAVNLESYLRRSEASLRVGDVRHAEAELREALRLAPDHPYSHAALARTLAIQGRFDDAITEMQTALRAKPDLPGGHALLAEALYRASRMEAAAIANEQALRADPSDSGAWNLNGLIEMQRGRLEAAAAAFGKAIAGRPGLSQAQRGRARCLARLGRTEEAVRGLRQAVAARPDDWVLANELAWMLATSEDATARDGAEAVRLAEGVVDDESHRQPATLDTLAAAYAESGRFEDAVRTLREAIDRARASSHAPEHLQEYEKHLKVFEARQALRAKPAETIPQ